jgi:hypothetical protein
MAQIINITSEALQSTIRRLLPSQQGFGEDLQASNVVQPIIDLTPTAEGSVLQPVLQQAVAFGNASAFSVFNTTADIITTTGFFRITCVVNLQGTGSADQGADLRMTDGATTKVVWSCFITDTYSSFVSPSQNLDLVVFVDSGESVSWSCTDHAIARGSVRQIADRQGNLVNPVGFTFE